MCRYELWEEMEVCVFRAHWEKWGPHLTLKHPTQGQSPSYTFPYIITWGKREKQKKNQPNTLHRVGLAIPHVPHSYTIHRSLPKPTGLITPAAKPGCPKLFATTHWHPVSQCTPLHRNTRADRMQHTATSHSITYLPLESLALEAPGWFWAAQAVQGEPSGAMLHWILCSCATLIYLQTAS